MFETWFCTVLRLRKSSAVISALLRPCAIMTSISRSRSVSSGNACGLGSFLALVCHIRSNILSPDMSVALEGCCAKIQRADMHLDFLYQRVESFVDDGGPYKLHTQPDSKTGEITVYGQVLGEPPIDEWGAIIGDVVHNLRSALDHLVWQLTIAEGHKPPPNPIPKRGLGSEWRDIGFPIYVKPHPTDYLGTSSPGPVPKTLRASGESGHVCAQSSRGCSRLLQGRIRPKSRLRFWTNSGTSTSTATFIPRSSTLGSMTLRARVQNSSSESLRRNPLGHSKVAQR